MVLNLTSSIADFKHSKGLTSDYKWFLLNGNCWGFGNLGDNLGSSVCNGSFSFKGKPLSLIRNPSIVRCSLIRSGLVCVIALSSHISVKGLLGSGAGQSELLPLSLNYTCAMIIVYILM